MTKKCQKLLLHNWCFITQEITEITIIQKNLWYFCFYFKLCVYSPNLWGSQWYSTRNLLNLNASSVLFLRALKLCKKEPLNMHISKLVFTREKWFSYLKVTAISRNHGDLFIKDPSPMCMVEFIKWCYSLSKCYKTPWSDIHKYLCRAITQ